MAMLTKNYRLNGSIADRLAHYSMPEPNSGCTLWIGSIRPNGYGRLVIGRTSFLPHRLAYEIHVGPIPRGLVIDHLCRNRACINGQHLEAVTQRENIMRGQGVASINAKRTHCANGHPFDAVNTRRHQYGTATYRQCITCVRHRDSVRIRSRRKLAAAS